MGILQLALPSIVLQPYTTQDATIDPMYLIIDQRCVFSKNEN